MEEEKMKELHHLILDIRRRAVTGKGNSHLPARMWREEEILNGKPVKALVVVLRTSGCRWNACSMCGYFKDSLKGISPDDILKQVDHAISGYRDEEIIKIFTSGSFLDPQEIEFSLQKKIIEKLSGLKNLKVISVESRPEFVSYDRLNHLMKFIHPKSMEISIGLESANDKVLQYSINKGFGFSEYLESAKIVKEAGALLKTYILLKPPFLREREAIDDCVHSIEKIKDITDTVSLNPVSVHRYTLVEFLWERGEYRPPWLWSVVEVLKEGKKILKGKRIKCDITGRGKERGAHNCGECDNSVLDAIERFSLYQDVGYFEELQCDCIDEWRDNLDLEIFSLSPVVS